MTAGKKPHKECDFFCLFFNRNKQIEVCFGFVFFFREALSMYTFLWADRKEPQSGEGVGLDGSFPAGAGAGYIQVSLEQSLPLTQINH